MAISGFGEHAVLAARSPEDKQSPQGCRPNRSPARAILWANPFATLRASPTRNLLLWEELGQFSTTAKPENGTKSFKLS